MPIFPWHGSEAIANLYAKLLYARSHEWIMTHAETEQSMSIGVQMLMTWSAGYGRTGRGAMVLDGENWPVCQHANGAHSNVHCYRCPLSDCPSVHMSVCIYFAFSFSSTCFLSIAILTSFVCCECYSLNHMRGSSIAILCVLLLTIAGALSCEKWEN